MSAPTKLRPGNSELTRLKAIWGTLSDDARSYWLELFASQQSQAATRKELLAKFKVNLRFDAQLTAFRKFVKSQQVRDDEAERQVRDEEQLREQFGEWTKEQIREEVIRRSYARSLTTGDFSEGRKTIVQDLNIQKVALDRDKFEFDAAEMALAKVATLKTISASKLSDVEKINAARRALFGELPPEPELAKES